MIVLGIDPGSRVTGWGIVTRERGRYRRVASGAIRTPADAALPVRLRCIHAGLRDVMERYRPDAVAVEAIFRHRSSESALKLGHARGVALLAAAEVDLPVHEYGTTHVKKAAAGYGRADKAQVGRVVAMLVGEEVEGPEDVTDALALAICHLAHLRIPVER